MNNNQLKSMWNCLQVHLRWPTDLAINPLDNSLHIIDDHMILQLTPDGRVKVVSGRPLHCPAHGHDSELATHATLVMPQSIAFGPNGDLYVAESDSQRINRIRVIGKEPQILNLDFFLNRFYNMFSLSTRWLWLLGLTSDKSKVGIFMRTAINFWFIKNLNISTLNTFALGEVLCCSS